MKRETGYYWVKTDRSIGWIVLKYEGGEYYNQWVSGSLIYSEIIEINETRILNPDEKRNKQSKK